MSLTLDEEIKELLTCKMSTPREIKGALKSIKLITDELGEAPSADRLKNSLPLLQ